MAGTDVAVDVEVDVEALAEPSREGDDDEEEEVDIKKGLIGQLTEDDGRRGGGVWKAEPPNCHTGVGDGDDEEVEVNGFGGTGIMCP